MQVLVTHLSGYMYACVYVFDCMHACVHVLSVCGLYCERMNVHKPVCMPLNVMLVCLSIAIVIVCVIAYFTYLTRY